METINFTIREEYQPSSLSTQQTEAATIEMLRIITKQDVVRASKEFVDGFIHTSYFLSNDLPLRIERDKWIAIAAQIANLRRRRLVGTNPFLEILEIGNRYLHHDLFTTSLDAKLPVLEDQWTNKYPVPFSKCEKLLKFNVPYTSEGDYILFELNDQISPQVVENWILESQSKKTISVSMTVRSQLPSRVVRVILIEQYLKMFPENVSEASQIVVTPFDRNTLLITLETRSYRIVERISGSNSTMLNVKSVNSSTEGLAERKKFSQQGRRSVMLADREGWFVVYSSMKHEEGLVVRDSSENLTGLHTSNSLLGLI